MARLLDVRPRPLSGLLLESQSNKQTVDVRSASADDRKPDRRATNHYTRKVDLRDAGEMAALAGQAADAFAQGGPIGRAEDFFGAPETVPVNLTGLGELAESNIQRWRICHIENGKRPPDSRRWLSFDLKNRNAMDFFLSAVGGKIRYSFYRSRYFEKGFIANWPTKKFCEIAAISVWPSY
jgi:hypothetical protein